MGRYIFLSVLRIQLILMRIQVISFKFTEFFITKQNFQKKKFLFFLLIFMLKLNEPFRNQEIFIMSLFSIVQIWVLRVIFFCSFRLIFFQEAKILRIQRIRILSTDFYPCFPIRCDVNVVFIVSLKKKFETKYQVWYFSFGKYISFPSDVNRY